MLTASSTWLSWSSVGILPDIWVGRSIECPHRPSPHIWKQVADSHIVIVRYIMVKYLHRFTFAIMYSKRVIRSNGTNEICVRWRGQWRSQRQRWWRRRWWRRRRRRRRRTRRWSGAKMRAEGATDYWNAVELRRNGDAHWWLPGVGHCLALLRTNTLEKLTFELGRVSVVGGGTPFLVGAPGRLIEPLASEMDLAHFRDYGRIWRRPAARLAAWARIRAASAARSAPC